MDNDNCFVLCQHSELDLYKRPIAPLGHIILGPRQSVSTFIRNCCVSNKEATNGVWSNSRLIALGVHANHDTTNEVTRITRKLQVHKFQWFVKYRHFNDCISNIPQNRKRGLLYVRSCQKCHQIHTMVYINASNYVQMHIGFQLWKSNVYL